MTYYVFRMGMFKITENSENTGVKTILLVQHAHKTSLWEPFSERNRGNYRLECSIYKNIASSVVVFEENNIDLELTCRYAWRMSEKFGFVKTTWLINTGATACQVEFVDGLQNILPANVTMPTQNTLSSLLEAYKRSEVDAETGLAIFSLSSILTDLAEPSESLLATTVAQLGLDHPDILLSPVQLDPFRRGFGVTRFRETPPAAAAPLRAPRPGRSRTSRGGCARRSRRPRSASRSRSGRSRRDGARRSGGRTRA